MKVPLFRAPFFIVSLFVLGFSIAFAQNASGQDVQVMSRRSSL